MCIICLNPNSSRNEIEVAEKQHRREKLNEKAIYLKDMIGDCRNIIRILADAGTSDPTTEKLLRKLLNEQYELSKEM